MLTIETTAPAEIVASFQLCFLINLAMQMRKMLEHVPDYLLPLSDGSELCYGFTVHILKDINYFYTIRFMLVHIAFPI